MEQGRKPEVRCLKAAFSGERLDKYIADECTDLTRSHIQRLIQAGKVKVNGSPARPALKLQESDYIEISIPAVAPAVLVPEEIPFEIVYEDRDFVVINKPPGLTVYPAPGHASHTLVNALLQRFPDLAVFGGSLRPGIVHRLDKDTSGLMVIARNEPARQQLIEQFKSRMVTKGYMVLVKGKLSPSTGAIDAPIGRDPSNRQRMAVVSTGRPARTDFKVIKYVGGCTLVEVFIRTGRTHQIRVHFAAIGFPVMGDPVYGAKTVLLRRQFLHSSYLQFTPPSGGAALAFKCDLPEDLALALHIFNKKTA